MTIQELPTHDHRAFPAYPSVDCYFPTESSEQTRLRLSRTIERGDGPGLLIGASGTGKSLLLQVLAEQFRGRFDVAILSCAQLCTRRALLQGILFELGLPYRYHDEGELRFTLLDHLLPSERCPHGILLLVDEAQSLPARLLEEIRLLTNVMRNGVPRTRLVLAGSPSLEELLTVPELESLQQRIAARCYLAPFKLVETEQYIRAQLAALDDSVAPVVDADAVRAVYDATDGVPRLVNQLCDAALFMARRKCARKISPEIVQESWADLQQLPTPWETEPASLAPSAGHDIIEFGQLGEDPADTDRTDVEDVVHLAEPMAAELTSPDEFANEPVAEIPQERAAALSDEEELAEIENEGTDSDEQPTHDEFPHHRDQDPSHAEFDAFANATNLPATERPPLPEDLPRDVALANENAVNPFQEAFDDEIVLDSFSVLGDVFHADSPKVENRKDENISTMVQEALDLSRSRAGNSDSDGFCVDDLDVECSSDAEVADILESVPLISLATESVELASRYDPVFPEDGATEDAVATDPSVTLKYPAVPENVLPDEETPSRGAVIGTETECMPAETENVLIIDDIPIDATAEEPTVRRMEYAQLFAQLRGE